MAEQDDAFDVDEKVALGAALLGLAADAGRDLLQLLALVHDLLSRLYDVPRGTVRASAPAKDATVIEEDWGHPPLKSLKTERVNLPRELGHGVEDLMDLLGQGDDVVAFLIPSTDLVHELALRDLNNVVHG